MMGECQSSPLPLPPDFILPEGKRPNLSEVSRLASIPIIDLTHELSKLTQEISRACEDYGFFQVINHGVPGELCGKMMNSISSFFETFPEEKAKFYAANNDDDSNTRQVKLQNFHLKVNADGCSGGEGGEMEIRMWSETLSYPCHSLHEIIHLLPDNPPRYREVFAAYAEEVGGLTTRLLSLISQGLGLQKDCLQKRLGNKPRQRAHANYYPPCPSPELTLGLAVHTDPHALTLLRQMDLGADGLQVIKDGKWVAVNPVPDAFIVNLGDQIEVLSNGRYKSVHHRAVMSKERSRVSLAMFYAPDKDAVIGPVEDLIDGEHSRMYREYRYSEFLEEFGKQEGTRWMVKETFRPREGIK